MRDSFTWTAHPCGRHYGSLRGVAVQPVIFFPASVSTYAPGNIGRVEEGNHGRATNDRADDRAGVRL